MEQTLEIAGDPVRAGSEGVAFEEEFVRACLERIFEFQPVRSSTRLSSLLRYLADECLAGRGGELTQYTIAAEAFQISNVYDADQNSLVRVHASRLRRVLKAYYAGPGASDVLRVRLPAGSYVLEFGAGVALGEGQGKHVPVVGLLEFKGLGLDDYWRHLPLVLAEELSGVMQRQGHLRFLGPFSRRLLEAEGLDPVKLGSRHAVDFILDGSVERTEKALILRTRLLEGATGMQIWAGREELDLARPDLAGFEGVLMRRLSASLGEDGGIISRHLSSLARVKPDDMLTVYEAVLLGRMYLSDYDHRALPRVLSALRRAVRQAPDESAPHATLAVLLSMLGMEPNWPGDPPHEEIREHTRLAMRLNPEDMWSILAQACLATLDHEWRELARIGRSLADGGFEAPAMLLGGVGVLLCCQKTELALGEQLIRQAISANPHHMKIFHIGLVFKHLDARNFDGVRSELDAFQCRWGLSDPLIRGAVAALEGDAETARGEWARVLEAFPSFLQDGVRSLGYLWHQDFVCLIREAYQTAGVSIHGS
jgi:TolB-like protein